MMSGILLVFSIVASNPLNMAKRVAKEVSIDSAVALLDHIIDSARGTPLEGQALLLKADIFMQIGDDGRAVTILNSMRRIQLSNEVADTTYSILLKLTSDPKEKTKLLSEFINKYPFASRREAAIWNLVNLFLFLNMPDSAMMALKRLSADYPNGRDSVQVRIGELRIETGNPDRGILLSKRHLDSVPLSHYVISRAYATLGDTGLALALGHDETGKCLKCMANEISLLNEIQASSRAMEITKKIDVDFDRWPLELKKAWSVMMINMGKADTVFKLGGISLFDEDEEKPYRTLLNFRFYILSEQLDSALSIIDSMPLIPPFTNYIVDFANKLINMRYPHEALPILELIYSHGTYYPLDSLLSSLHRCYIALGDYGRAANLEVEMERFGVPIDTSAMDQLQKQIDAFKRLFQATGDSTFLDNARKLEATLPKVRSDTLTERIRAMITDGRVEEAFKIVDLDRYDLLFDIAKGFLANGDTAQAYGVLGLIPIKGFKLDHDAFVLREIIGYRLGKFEQVVNDFQNSRDSYASFAVEDSLWLYVGLSYIALGNYHDALKTLYPLGDEFAADGIAISLMKLGYADRVKEIKGVSNDVAVRCAIKTGDVEWLKSLNPPVDKILLREYLIAIADSDPNYAMALADSVGVSYIVKGEIAVIKALKNNEIDAAKENAATPLTFYRIGVFYMRHGMLDSARAYLRKALDEGGMLKAAFKLGTVYYSQDLALEAVKYYQMAMKDDSLRPIALYNLAAAFKTLRKKDSAIFYYKKVMKDYGYMEISLDAEDALAYMLQDMGKNEDALDYWNDIEGELKNFSDEIELKYWKAEALFALNRSREALNYYLMVANSDTKSEWKIIAMLKAAKIYAIIGEKGRAIALYQKVIKLAGPTSQFSDVARKELETLKSQ